jgi:flagellar M-ring protein FliF
MRDRLPQSVRRVMSVFGSFTTGQKAVTMVGIAAIIIGGFFFATWAAKPSYSPLFSNLSGTDASAIVDQLNADGTKYELADGGKTIMVPKDKVYDLRLTMSGKGLPAEADTGYSLLDKQGVTTSEFMQHVGYQRALEGELANTIKSIDGVQAANVHLVIPQKDVFADDEKKPTASVLITTRGGDDLDQNQVQAIVHLVAASVEGLDADQVTVADAKGNVLSAGGGETVAAAGDQRSKQTADFEQRMNTAVARMLDSVVGTGHAVVKTTADLDFDQTETKTQTYKSDPKTVPLSESTTNETYNGTGGTSGGVLGPDNIQVPGNANGNGTYNKSTAVRNNAVGLVTETRKSAPGNVRRLSVAVLLDSTVAPGVNQADVEKMVSSAVGLDTTTRGDTISVTQLPFDNSADQAAQQQLASAAKAEREAQLFSLAKTAGMVLLVLLMILIAWRFNRRRAKRTKLSEEELARIEQMQAALEEARARTLDVAEQKVAQDVAAANGTANQIAGKGPAPVNVDAEERRARQKEISILAERKPGEVAQLLRGWLAERRS